MKWWLFGYHHIKRRRNGSFSQREASRSECSRFVYKTEGKNPHQNKTIGGWGRNGWVEMRSNRWHPLKLLSSIQAAAVARLILTIERRFKVSLQQLRLPCGTWAAEANTKPCVERINNNKIEIHTQTYTHQTQCGSISICFAVVIVTFVSTQQTHSSNAENKGYKKVRFRCVKPTPTSFGSTWMLL